MKIILAFAFLAFAAAELEAPEPVYLQEPDEFYPQIYPVDARPLIVPPQILEAIQAMDPNVVAYEVPAEGINFVDNPQAQDESVMFVNDPEQVGYKRPLKIFVDPNLR